MRAPLSRRTRRGGHRRRQAVQKVVQGVLKTVAVRFRRDPASAE
jgi:hypothetical protein